PARPRMGRARRRRRLAEAQRACAGGWLDQRAAHVAAAEKVAEVEREQEAAREAAARAGVATFRRVAHEWLAWKREVKGGAPSTLRDNALLLREPGEPHRRG